MYLAYRHPQPPACTVVDSLPILAEVRNKPTETGANASPHEVPDPHEPSHTNIPWGESTTVHASLPPDIRRARITPLVSMKGPLPLGALISTNPPGIVGSFASVIVTPRGLGVPSFDPFTRLVSVSSRDRRATAFSADRATS